MERPKKINIPFLLLILLFVLAQTAFALSASVSYDDMTENVQGNNTEDEYLLTDNDNNMITFNTESIPASAAGTDPDKTAMATEPEPDTVLTALTAPTPAPSPTPTPTPTPSPTPMPEIKSVVKYVNADKLNVREKATKESNLVTSLTRGDKVTYYETVGEWARITTGTDKNGYVLAEYIVDSPDKTVKPKVKYVNADKLNVREKATKESKLVTSITRGDKVTYYETVGEWAKITTWTDKNGYVLAKYLVDSADKVAKPATSRSSTSSSTEPAPPQSAEGQTLADKIVEYSKTLLGVPYVWGGHSTKGFDCSGFTQYVFGKFGIKLPSSSYAYSSVGTKVSRSELQKGDILLWDTDKNGTVGHVGIYIGNGVFIHASSSKGKVVTRSLSSYSEKYLGARRVIK